MGSEMLRCAQHDNRVLAIPAAFWPTRTSARLRLKPVANPCGTPERIRWSQWGRLRRPTALHTMITFL